MHGIDEELLSFNDEVAHFILDIVKDPSCEKLYTGSRLNQHVTHL